jgi:Tfp pilus assembly protein PilN
MIRRSSRWAVPNFSQDTRGHIRRLSAALALVAVGLSALAVWLVADGLDLGGIAEDNRSLEERLALKIADVRQRATEAPSVEAFDGLSSRIRALNDLDFAAQLGVSELFDILETIIPDQVLLSSLRYDRARGMVDLAASSASSEELTRFFEALHKQGRFFQARLTEKLQIDAQGGLQTQVRIQFHVGQPRPQKEARL